MINTRKISILDIQLTDVPQSVITFLQPYKAYKDETEKHEDIYDVLGALQDLDTDVEEMSDQMMMVGLIGHLVSYNKCDYVRFVMP